MRTHQIKCISVMILVAGFFISLNEPVFAQSNQLEPIIIVPGIMGSWNWNVLVGGSSPNTWDFFATDHTWDNTISALETAGYERNKNLFIAFYDWRQSNINSATDYLIPIIDKALINSSTGKVNIVAHSMGGLVSRRYIQSNQYRGDVDNLIMLGTPNYGSSDVYTLWEGGDIPKNWNKSHQLGLSFVLSVMTNFSVQTDDYYDTIHTYIPSVGELLPTYDFLTDSEGGTKPHYNLIEAQNAFLENLNDPAHTENLRELGHITVIAGKGEGTVGNIPVVDRSGSENKLWADGMPEPVNPVRNDTEGDNRVLLSSAFLNEFTVFPPQQVQNFWQRLYTQLLPKVYAQFEDEEPHAEDLLTQIEVASKHGALPTTAIPEVFSALGLANPVGDFEPPVEPDNVTSFWFASPVAVKVTDPQGRSITKDSNQIPGAVYTGETDPNGVKMVIIPDGLSGQYTVELVGTANGEYHMGVANFTDEADNTVTVQKSVKLGEQIKYTAVINTETGAAAQVSAPIVTLPHTDPPIEKSAIDLTKELIDSLEKYYKDKKIDNKGLYQSLLNDLKIALGALKEAELARPLGVKYPKLHELKVKLVEKLAIGKLESFISEIKKQEKKSKITKPVSDDLINQAKLVISKI